MRGRDPLASLARLRRLQSGAARRRLAEDAGRLLAAEDRERAADAALLSERASCGPADYAAWIGRGVAERDRAALAAAAAAKRLAEARTALAEARVAERCVQQLALDRLAEARARAGRKAQAAMDDAANRKGPTASRP